MSLHLQNGSSTRFSPEPRVAEAPVCLELSQPQNTLYALIRNCRYEWTPREDYRVVFTRNHQWLLVLEFSASLVYRRMTTPSRGDATPDGTPHHGSHAATPWRPTCNHNIHWVGHEARSNVEWRRLDPRTPESGGRELGKGEIRMGQSTGQVPS